MNRKDFFKRLFGAIAVAVITPSVLAKKEKSACLWTKEDWDNILEGTEMTWGDFIDADIVQEGNKYAIFYGAEYYYFTGRLNLI